MKAGGSSVTMAIVDELKRVLDDEKVRTDAETLQARRHDYWVLSHLDDLQDRPAPTPACVVRPANVEDVVATVNACRESGTALIPFGLGSGVCGGVVAHPESVLIDMSAMDRVRFIDEKNLLAGFDAGHNGMAAERAVAARGLTIGHWPQSIDVSTVGGWVATRAAGQFSTGYGSIEDIIYSIEAVLPTGQVIEAGKAPRAAAGPDLRHLFLGSEGTLGVITGVTFMLRRAAEQQTHLALYARDMEAGLDAQRQIVQAGWLPVVMRQYDSSEAHRLFPDQARGDDAFLLFVHEGPAARVEAELAATRAIAHGAGLEDAPVEAVAHWLAERNHVPTWDRFLQNGVVLDTIEISATWNRIGPIYRTALAALQEVEGILNASAHSSHVYRSGINLYFTFAARPDDPAAMADTYRECWRRVMTATADGGGGVAHHHGIGRLRRPYIGHDLGQSGVQVLRALKQALDPTGFMNPGVLVPDA